MSFGRPLRSLVVVLAFAALARLAVAHDFWVHPSTYRPAAGTDLDLTLYVGDHFEGEAYARNPRHVVSFVMVGPKGTTEIGGDEGRTPAGRVRVTEKGLHVIGYRSSRSRSELEAEAFEDYLTHEGLEHVKRARADRGETDQPGREVFSRCAKSLVRVTQDGDAGTTAGFDRTLGLDLEVVPVTDPYALPKDGKLRVRVLYAGKPLANSRVTAHHAAARDGACDGRTDVKGEVVLTIDRAGEWMLNTVHMVPAPKRLDAEWESLWASLTFEATAAAVPPPPTRETSNGDTTPSGE